ncbi:TetR/AcrR family transcriptional regulator [Mycolicibacterium sp.]|uniref:TetR/AcrR family transcriptional regulator n=1 Tax=Mycolicibacterium sp. TaxID=2320850 RepID=UPI003D14744E
MASDPEVPARGRGRPVGADAEVTRRRILDAAREVIAERGQAGATFQLIAARAAVSRPTLHYYFNTREHVYDILLRDAATRVHRCATDALREENLYGQLRVFVTAIGRLSVEDGVFVRFLVAAGVDRYRRRERSAAADALVATVQGACRTMVVRAMGRGEVPAGTDVGAVADMLAATFWGLGLSGGFAGAPEAVARQLVITIRGGLLAERDGPAGGG